MPEQNTASALRELVRSTNENKGYWTESIDSAMQSCEAALEKLEAVEAQLGKARDQMSFVLDALAEAATSSRGDKILNNACGELLGKAVSVDALVRGLILAMQQDHPPS